VVQIVNGLKASVTSGQNPFVTYGEFARTVGLSDKYPPARANRSTLDEAARILKSDPQVGLDLTFTVSRFYISGRTRLPARAKHLRPISGVAAVVVEAAEPRVRAVCRSTRLGFDFVINLQMAKADRRRCKRSFATKSATCGLMHRSGDLKRPPPQTPKIFV
jgi:hypothetical protein